MLALISKIKWAEIAALLAGKVNISTAAAEIITWVTGCFDFVRVEELGHCSFLASVICACDTELLHIWGSGVLTSSHHQVCVCKMYKSESN